MKGMEREGRGGGRGRRRIGEGEGEGVGRGELGGRWRGSVCVCVRASVRSIYTLTQSVDSN